MSTAGFVLQNRYQATRLIAQGSSGSVFQAQDQRLNSAVALKEIRTNDAQLRTTIVREAQLLAGLRHPSLPKVTDYFSEADAEFLVMEFIPGPNLAELLQQRGRPFPVDQVLRWADQLLDALEYLHWQQFPIIHRDIKPQNLKLTDRAEIILLDFGLTQGGANRTQPISGSSPYLSIEQIRGFGVDGRSDIYALGATLYHLLTGQPPLDAVSRATDLAGGQPDYLTPANKINPDVPVALSDLLNVAMALNRDQRPESAAVFRGRLREFGVAEPANRNAYATVSAPTPPPINPPTVPFVQAPPPSPITPEVAARPLSAKPPTIEAQQFMQQSPQADGKKGSSLTWLVVLVIALAIIFISIIVIAVVGPGLFWKGSSRAGANATKPKITIPSPYDESLKSVATVVMQNADGQPVSQSDGFFLREDQIVVPLAVIDGASKGHIRLAGKTTDFDISSVTNIDRDRGLAILKLDGPTATPVTPNSERKVAIGDKMVILGSDQNSDPQYIEAAISDYKQNEDILEIRFPSDVTRGSLVLDEHGQAVGIISITSPSDHYLKIVVPIARVTALAKRDQPPLSIAVAGANQLLYDFRRPSTKKAARVTAASAQKIIAAVFPSYLKDGQTCGEEYHSLEDARALGQISPSVEGVATGSFTAPGLKQTAYTINVGECNASHADGFGTKRVVIFENQKLVANVDVDQHSAILQVYDLDQDGVNELLLEAFAMGQGTSVQHSILVDFQGGKYRVVHDFGQTDYDSCASGLKKSSFGALAIYYAPTLKGQMPEFRTDVYRANCGGKLRYLTTGNLPEQ